MDYLYTSLFLAALISIALLVDRAHANRQRRQLAEESTRPTHIDGSAGGALSRAAEADARLEIAARRGLRRPR